MPRAWTTRQRSVCRRPARSRGTRPGHVHARPPRTCPACGGRAARVRRSPRLPHRSFPEGPAAPVLQQHARPWPSARKAASFGTPPAPARRKAPLTLPVPPRPPAALLQLHATVPSLPALRCPGAPVCLGPLQPRGLRHRHQSQNQNRWGRGPAGCWAAPGPWVLRLPRVRPWPTAVVPLDERPRAHDPVAWRRPRASAVLPPVGRPERGWRQRQPPAPCPQREPPLPPWPAAASWALALLAPSLAPSLAPPLAHPQAPGPQAPTLQLHQEEPRPCWHPQPAAPRPSAAEQSRPPSPRRRFPPTTRAHANRHWLHPVAGQAPLQGPGRVVPTGTGSSLACRLRRSHGPAPPRCRAAPRQEVALLPARAGPEAQAGLARRSRATGATPPRGRPWRRPRASRSRSRGPGGLGRRRRCPHQRQHRRLRHCPGRCQGCRSLRSKSAPVQASKPPGARS
mmetsp:Transcript_16612/g.45673  ORF Transcript_16612/g.45673 Transcript_16612/m.45673 type:complete len:454 (-) Transcript_16612:223-1584(-)